MFDVKPITTDRDTCCGPACLAMLLNYYEKPYDLNALIDECNARLIGTTMKDLSRVGKAHGLDMMHYKMDADELIRQDRPAIVWWQYNHFVIFAGQDENGQVVICNPSRGRYRMSKALFSSWYSGIASFNGEPHDIEP